MSGNLAISATITDAHSFKKFIVALKTAKLKIMSLVFMPTCILINEFISNEMSDSELIVACLSGQNLSYTYNLDTPQFVASLGVDDLCGIFDYISTRNGVKFYIYQDNMDHLYMEFIQGNLPVQDNVYKISFCNKDPTFYNKPEMDEKVCKVASGTIEKFDSINRSIKRSKEGITIKFLSGQIIIQREENNNKLTSLHSFGEPTDIPEDENNILTYDLKPATVKLIQKLVTVSAKRDTIKFVGNHGMPLKMSTSLGNFGQTELYIYPINK